MSVQSLFEAPSRRAAAGLRTALRVLVALDLIPGTGRRRQSSIQVIRGSKAPPTGASQPACSI
jgi:hypothetical protein